MTLARPLLLLLIVTASSLVPSDTSAGTDTYRLRRYDLQRLPWYERSHTGWHRLRLPPKPPVDRRGLPLELKGGVLSYAVGELSINGMRRLVRWHVACERPQLDQALKQARALRRLMVGKRDASWIPHGFDAPGEFQRAPWYDAMVQGLALSFFVRLHEATGKDVHFEAAHRVFRSFLRLGRSRRPWVAYVDEDRYLWLEHFPSHLGSHPLNAHLHALFGLYEYWLATDSDEARRVLEGAITTIEDNVRRYRQRGGISLYDLHWRRRILKYHEIHIWQLDLLAAITSEPFFARMADRFREDWPSGTTWRGTPGYPPIPRRLRPRSAEPDANGVAEVTAACPPVIATDRPLPSQPTASPPTQTTPCGEDGPESDRQPGPPASPGAHIPAGNARASDARLEPCSVP